MKAKRFFGLFVLLGYLTSTVLSYLGYIDFKSAFANTDNRNATTQLVAVLVDDKIYDTIEDDLKRYASDYIQKKYPHSKALVLKINTKEYSAPEIVKLLENLYFDGLKDQSSSLIGLVLIGNIPLPVVKYGDYIFPSIYPYVDFLEQKYLWDEETGYFTQNLENGQAEIWHGLVNFEGDIQDYHNFFKKLQEYDKNPSDFIEKKIWYDDFIALKKNFLDDAYNMYQNKLIFAEDLMYHRYTNFLVNILQGHQEQDNVSLLWDLSQELSKLWVHNSDLTTSIDQLQKKKIDYTPTKLLEQKIQSFLREYHEIVSTPLLNTISENVKASDRRTGSDSHYSKLFLKDQILLGDTKTNGILKSLNDKLESYVDQKVNTERYAMKNTVPIYYQQSKDKKRRIFLKKYYIPEFKDIYQFFYFGRNAQTISNALDFSLFRGTFRNLTGFVNYSQIIGDTYNPAKSKEDKTDLTKKGLWSSYDLFSTQVESNRGYNVLNTESEYNLYQKEKKHARIDRHCSKRLFGLKWKWLPCVKSKWEPIGKCNPESDNPKDRADCENFQQFGNRVRGGATPLNINMEELQNQNYSFSGTYDPKSAWKEIFDIAGSVPVTSAQYDATSFKAGKTYVSPTQTARREGELKDATGHNISLDQVWYFNVTLSDKVFKSESSSVFSLKKEKKNRQDLELLYKYKIIPSVIKHDATSAQQINGYSGLKYSENTESRGYYTSIKEGLTYSQDVVSSWLLQKLQTINSQLITLKNSVQTANSSYNPSTIKNLIPTSAIQSISQLSSGQAKLRWEFNDIITKSYAGESKNAIEWIILRQINQKEKIWLLQNRYREIFSSFSVLQSFLSKEQQIGDQIFSTFSQSIQALTAIKNTIQQGISTHQGTWTEDQELRKAWESLYQPLSELSGAIERINQLEPCTANHSILWTMLWKDEQLIDFWNEKNGSCSMEEESSEGENSNSSEAPLQTEIANLSETKNLFVLHFFSDASNPTIEISGMNILTPERPIDSPKYLSFQGVGENEIKLIYPNLFKVEVYDKNLKNPNQIRESLVQYLKNKVSEYNQILLLEKQKAKKLDDHYLKLYTVDQLATPSLSVRPYKMFTYDEMLKAIGWEKMLNTLAELIYYQNISNQTKQFRDNIESDIQDIKATFDINQKIWYIINNYLTQDKEKIYLAKNTYPNPIIPNYNATGYEVGYINSDSNDTVIPNQYEDIDITTSGTKSSSLDANLLEETVWDAKEAFDVQKECWFDINEGLLLYNFKTGKFDWREGLKCWLKNVKKKPFELKLSFEGSLGAVPIKDTIKNDIVAPLQDSRGSYRDEVKATIWFQDLEPYEEYNNDTALQEILNQTQITIQNKKISILSKTGFFNFLSLKDYGNLRVKFTSTGDNCLIIKGKNTCDQEVEVVQSPFKKGFDVNFQLGKNTVGTIVTTLKLCSTTGKCTTKPISLFAVPGNVHSFEIWLPQDKKILAGAYTLISLKALDIYKNEIQRTLEPYTIEVDKWNLVIWGQERKSQEVNDFQNLTLLYKGQANTSSIVKFSVKNKKWELLSSNTAVLVPWTLHLEQNGKEISSLEYQISAEHYFTTTSKGDMQLNTKKAIPIELVLRDTAGKVVPLTTNVLLGAKKNLSQIMTLQTTLDNNKKKKLTLTPINSLFIENGKATIYLIPGYLARKETIIATVPGLPEKTIALSINPGPLDKINLIAKDSELETNSSSTLLMNLTDARGNKLQTPTKIYLESTWSVIVSPRGTMNIPKGEALLSLQSTDQWGKTRIYAEAQGVSKKIQGATTVTTKTFFLNASVESGLNIMYLNLFGNDRGNQWWYHSDNKKFWEKILEKSDKTLAITTELIDPKKVKKASLILWKNAEIKNLDAFNVLATQKQWKLTLQIANFGAIEIQDRFSKIKTYTSEVSLDWLLDHLNADSDKSLYIYNIDSDFSYDKGTFSTKDGNKIASLENGISFQWTSEYLGWRTVRNVVGNNQILAKALFTNLDFSKSLAKIENKEYDFGSLFANGSTNQQVKAIFSNLNILKTDYQWYDSIQNSDEMEKYIGFRGNFKNITAFAGGQSVGEATIPFGSEFLINIWDPVLRRIDQNKNLASADYNQGLGKVVYTDPNKPIFMTKDIDYNDDGLRDLLVIYKDWEIKLQKQYQNKKFKDMGTLMISAEPIKEVMIWDVDGNGFDDIIVRNTKDQLRIYTNDNGVFDVDWNIACLNTNSSLWSISTTPENLSGVHQLFLKDMDADKKLDIITLDKKGYLKIFYGNGDKKNHSYLSQNKYNCDEDRYERQEKSTKIVKKFWLQLNWERIRDESLIRRDGLFYPTEEELSQSLQGKNNREKGIDTDPIILKKIENNLVAPCAVVDYSCERNSYWEQFCKKFRRYNRCKACPIPSWPVPPEKVCPSNQEYREMDRQHDDQRISGKPSYEDGMCRIPPQASCVLDGWEENWRIDSESKEEIVSAQNGVDVTNTAQEGIGVLDKYIKNPFWHLEKFSGQDNWAFIPINKLETPSQKILWDKVRDVSKKYIDINWWDLEDGDTIQVEVVIINKYATFWEWSAFFDKITGPRIINQDKNTHTPKISFQEGSASINSKTDEYAYYLTGLKFSAKNEIVYTYNLTYSMPDPLVKIDIDDIDIEDYSVAPKIIRTAPRDWLNQDGILDITINPAKDGCNKKQSILFNTKNRKTDYKEYRESIIDLQELSNAYGDSLSTTKGSATNAVENSIKNTQDTQSLKSMPGIDEIQESVSTKDILKNVWSSLKEGNPIDVEFFGEELDEIERNVQDAADKMCNGFSFWLSNVKSCEGLPVPFNQAFLAPGKYHLMWCIPIEPLTRSLWGGLPVFHYPGTLQTPVGPIPIPWGLKWPWDGFLRVWGGTYPSMIRIYAAPTLTAQMGLAICLWNYNAGINLPSPFSDIGGNCIVTSMPLPCGKKSANEKEKLDTSNVKGQEYHPWVKDYWDTTTCQLAQSDSPFKIVASALTNSMIPTSLPEGSYLGGAINIDYDAITSEMDSEQSGISLNGVKIQGVKDIKNAILGGKQQGIQQKLVGRFDKQMQYWINNLLRFRVEFIFPDMDVLNTQISTLNFKEIWKLTNEWTTKSKVEIWKLASKFKDASDIKTLVKTVGTNLQSKEKLTALNLANGDNPFEKLQAFFNEKELVNISSQTLNVRIPWIYSEDIEAYKNYLLTWVETNKEVLNWREKVISSAILSCQKEIGSLKWDALEQKKSECKAIQDAKTQIMQMQSKFDKTSEQIYQNIQTLELYKRFPLELYEWLHVSDKYLAEISALLSKFFGYINYWMEVNANRFSQYTDAIITIIWVVKTYQIMVDLFVDRGKKCGKCSVDSYDQYSCKLSFLCPDLPIIPIPSVKIPSLYIDLSHLNLGMDIVLPRFNFVPESIELPRLPNLPEPPQLWVNFKIDFNIPDIPQLPEPPTLPELPSFIPQVKMQLPILPPAPEIPELPNKLTTMVNIAKKLSKIYCIIKSWIGLVGESSVKARIEQMTQRTYNVPRVDNLDLTAYFKQTPLQWVDIQVDSYVNLQYNFDAFYSLLKGMVDTINQQTYSLTSQAQTLSDTISDQSDNISNMLNETTDKPINVNVNIGHIPQLKKQLSELRSQLTDKEKEKIIPILALASTESKVSSNQKDFSKIENQISSLIESEKGSISSLVSLAKSDYNGFLRSLEKKPTKKPIQLTFSTHLLEKNVEAQNVISETNPTEELINTESKRLDGYYLALNSHSASDLNMSQETYDKAQNYLNTIKSKLNQRNSIKTKKYAGTQTLLSKDGSSAQKTLLTQVSSQKPAIRETSTTDLSPYVNGVLVKNHDHNLVNVVHSKINYEQFPSYYQQDLNNDKKSEVITRDEHNIYVKYADDAEAQISQKFRGFYVITPQLNHKDQKYEKFWGSWLGGKEEVKVYDDHQEVKNFRLEGQTFDSISFSRKNNHYENNSGYLMQISEKVGWILEKYDQRNIKYVLFLPNKTDISKVKLQIGNTTFKAKNQIWKLVYEAQYYNPTEDILQFNLHEVPRKRQYLQITSLKNSNNLYTKNAPRSNQIVGGRQVIWDTTPPKPLVELIRNRKPAIEDEGLDLQGYIGSYYDLRITRTDDLLVTTANIEENWKIIAKKNINASKGDIIIKNLFFTKEETKHYTIFAKDSEGNERKETINLDIKIPTITIENIEQISGRKEGIENPILITSELEKDIDKWNVSFEKQRNGTISTLTAIQKGKKIQIYPVTTNQTTVTGAYYDFGDMIGLYSVDKKLIATVNAKNGEITIQPAYQKSIELKVSFSKGYPIVNVVGNNKILFEIILKAQDLIQKEVLKGTSFSLEGNSYGNFDGGEVIMKWKEPLLYIAKNGTLRSNKPLQWSYTFDKTTNTVSYLVSENAFDDPFVKITIKVKSL